MQCGAALFVDKKLIGMGFVIRDHSGRFLAVKAGCGNGPLDADDAFSIEIGLELTGITGPIQ